MRSILIAMQLCLTSLLARPLATLASDVDFGRDIRPILSDKCFLCHGPADETRQADLRLDTRQLAVEAGAINSDDLLKSELLTRIFTDDSETVMPPPTSNKALTDREKGLIKSWVAGGATYSEHWAFTPPIRPSVPNVAKPDWSNNPIDNFVLARNEAEGRSQSPPAERSALARRIYLDLIGLPPTPEQLDDFLADESSDASQRLVDKLLDSEHFGERWARWWLDAARYADSDGYEKDKPRSVWFYRDWVIDSLNHDIPYDQFIVEQIAGDLLPGSGQDQRVATGFLRNSMINEEGGADPEQFRIEGMFDRMDAIGKAVLGITTQCAQCHTHKYDPLSQDEYYQMFAALNDFHEATMTCFTPEEARLRDAVLSEVQALEASVASRYPDLQDRIQTWAAAESERLVHWETLRPEEVPFEGQKFRQLDDGSIVSESYAPTKATNSFSLRANINGVTAFRLDVLMHPQLPRGGPGRSIYGTGALSEFEVHYARVEKPAEKTKIEIVRAAADVNPKHSLLPAIYREKDAAADDRVTGGIEYAIDGNNKTAWSTDNGPGRRNQDRHAIFYLAKPIEEAQDVILTITLKQNHGGWNSDDNQNYLLGRYRFSMTRSDSLASNPGVAANAPTGNGGSTLAPALIPSGCEQILLTPEDKRTDEQNAQLLSYWIAATPELSSVSDKIESAWQAFPETDTQLVVEARPPRETFVYVRGDFLSPGRRVLPDTPAFLGPMSESKHDEPARLRFARWLVRPDAPTTARVIVNRIWQAYFGRGLVATPEDFGFQSSPPSHPELLDWLAMELVESGWSLKHIHRLIVSSSTYQQTSAADSAAYADDPDNEYLARGPRLRVDAELVRDIALSISGLLDETIGGPSVYPPAPDFLFEPPTSYGPKIWNTASGNEQYRRSLYVHQYRSVPYPPMQVFDAPKGDAACIRRERSNTPLQALVMLNEPQFVQCARAFGTRILREGGNDDSARIQYAFKLSVSRLPSASEQQIVQEMLDQQRLRLASGELKAHELLGVDEATHLQLTGRPARETAAWMLVGRALLNMDETITKE